MMPKKPRRVCGYPGCEKLCRPGRYRFCSRQHVPREERIKGAKKAGLAFAFKSRRTRFARELQALKGRTLTQEQLLAVFQAIDYRAYNSGYMARIRFEQQHAQNRTAA